MNGAVCLLDVKLRTAKRHQAKDRQAPSTDPSLLNRLSEEKHIRKHHVF